MICNHSYPRVNEKVNLQLNIDPQLKNSSVVTCIVVSVCNVLECDKDKPSRTGIKL